MLCNICNHCTKAKELINLKITLNSSFTGIVTYCIIRSEAVYLTREVELWQFISALHVSDSVRNEGMRVRSILGAGFFFPSLLPLFCCVSFLPPLTKFPTAAPRVVLPYFPTSSQPHRCYLSMMAPIYHAIF
jgi:hypothetical protein